MVATGAAPGGRTVTLVFTQPAALLLLPLALLPWFFRRRTALTVPSLRPWRPDSPDWRCRLARLHLPLTTLILLGVILLLAGPVLRSRESIHEREGVDLVLALDISASMRAADMKPNRMAVARAAAADFVRRRARDRIGVILFAGTPWLLSPPTTDREHLAALLESVTAESRGTGTALGDAIGAALSRLKDSTARSRAIILLTDGRGNNGRMDAETAARAAAALQVRIYTIGFGTEQGAMVRFQTGGNMPPGHPVSGQRVSLDEATLRQLAESTGGRFFRATDADSLQQVYRRIDQLETSPLEVRTRTTDRPLADGLRPLLAALLVAELLLFRLWLRRWA
ncbi:MAG: VWA domain-containing protein [Deltaproteobacteria bacterium]|nr:MAG: VWA domain-containing protein [Deltaproteobacteria bacterium]